MATPASGRQVPIVGQIALSYALPLWRDRRKSNRSESRLHVPYAGAVRMVKSAGYHYTPHTLQARSSLLYGLPRRFAGRQLFVSGSPAGGSLKSARLCQREDPAALRARPPAALVRTGAGEGIRPGVIISLHW